MTTEKRPGLDPSDPVVQRVAADILAEPLRAAGMGEIVAESDTGNPLNLMWHADGIGPCPVPESPVWTHGWGCFDVVVEWRDSRLVVRTEGTEVLSEPWPEDLAAFESLLRGAAAHVGAVIRADIARFESENGGYLPGTEPGLGR